ncbi:MAG: hypothetical protein GTO60_17150, partial [Gammaproteobacteria bacterium]|nr:hypothetical protein [Gammaproteobacteria bacterium]NIO63668.1 hypothetical protein [Gammaproteobacteria bacterium]
VVGNAQNRIKTGTHLKFNGDPVSNVHMAVMKVGDIDPSEYLTERSDATGVLPGLLA